MTLQQALADWFASCPGALIAYSGGVDSAVVARAAHEQLGERSLAVIADSPSLARSELSTARQTAQSIGIPLAIVSTGELSDPNYGRNDAHRCFYCKQHLYTTLQQLPQHVEQGWWILSGNNADDVGDWRPGMKAASEHAVRSPLLELGMGKQQVRQLATLWSLPVAEKPASPCLASRLAYGLEVTAERLSMVEGAEATLRQLGLADCRVRLHADNLARIEVPVAQLPRLISVEVRRLLVERLAVLGFRFVTLDLEGLTSGSLNRLILPKLNI